MLFRCINNDEALTPPRFRHSNYTHPEYVHTTVTVGTVYPVFATMIYGDDLQLLIQDDRGSATWMDPVMFEKIDARLPPYWEFVSYEVLRSLPMQRRATQAMWGYPLIVRDRMHSTRLQERESWDRKAFQFEVERRAGYDM